MKKEDIDNIIRIICPNDEDFEKSIISPAYLKNELEALALEQEPILDKIRAEIGQITDTMGVSYNQYVSKIDVLQIIDKYRESQAESEDKE